MADKFTQLLIDALTQAAAEPTGVPLVAGKSEPGLFPAAVAAKPAMSRALEEGLLRVVRTETRGKTTRELYAATEKGIQFLIEQSNPKQILEDFVRALESREGQIGELLGTVRRLAESLSGMRAVAGMVLPQLAVARISTPQPPSTPVDTPNLSRIGVQHMNGTATLTAPVNRIAPALYEAEELAEAILARLTDWASSAGAGQDCPLPDLYRSLTCRENPPTIGAFHDSLRSLHAAGQVYLHPWTGPLYALPEPAYALLAGHNIAYYASTRCQT
ncbi:MAG: PadR family transcriptional regulator [Bacteroidales bacterium]|nr:PadR family transcriptional regulator [Bacteroidales bacterium]